MYSPWRRIRSGAILLGATFAVAVIGYRFLGGFDWIGAIWMVVITISTVGHGEESVFDPSMQLFTVGVILIGMTSAVYTFSGFFQLVLEGELDRALGRRRMTREIQRLSGHVIVCGYGRMGQKLVQDLMNEQLPLVVIDNDQNAVADGVSDGLLCVLGDATDEAVLESVGIGRARALVTSLPSDADSVFITLTARDMNPSLQIVARAEQQSTEKKLRQAGADRVVMPTLVGAKQMVRMLTRPGTAQLIDLVTDSTFQDIELDEVSLEADTCLQGKALAEIEALSKHNLLVIAIQREQRGLVVNPKGNETLQSHDIIMLMGHPDDIRNFRVEIGDDKAR